MTLLQLTPKLATVTTPQDFIEHRCWIGCGNCQKVTRHTIRMDGIRTYYRCTECRLEWAREGRIA